MTTYFRGYDTTYTKYGATLTLRFDYYRVYNGAFPHRSIVPEGKSISFPDNTKEFKKFMDLQEEHAELQREATLKQNEVNTYAVGVFRENNNEN